MFGKKFKFNEEELNKVILEALQEAPIKDKTARPNVLELKKTAAELNRIRNERT